MNPFTKQFHTRAHEVRLTDAERRRIYTRLHRTMYAAPTPSFSWMIPAFPQFAVLAALVLIVGSGGVAYASETALPGDPLYSVKVAIVEPVQGALAWSDDAKVAWNASVATTRLDEAQALAAQGSLTATTSAELAEDFKKHADTVAILTQARAKESASSTAFYSHFSSSVAAKGAQILAAGKRSKNQVALRASGNFVVNVSSQGADEKESTVTSSALAIAPKAAAPSVSAQARTFSTMEAVATSGSMEDEGALLRASLAEATSTFTGLTESERALVEAQAAQIQNLIVKAEAERSLGEEDLAVADFHSISLQISALAQFKTAPILEDHTEEPEIKALLR